MTYATDNYNFSLLTGREIMDSFPPAIAARSRMVSSPRRPG
jgi:hypothetical protein